MRQLFLIALLLAVACVVWAGSHESAGADETRLSFILDSATDVRARPSLVWPVITTVAAGRELAAVGVTPGPQPWLRVAEGESVLGWLPASATPLSDDQRTESLPVESAAALWASLRSAAPRMSLWAGGPETILTSDAPVLGASAPRFGVVGRSVDDQWVAVQLPSLSAPGHQHPTSYLSSWEVTVWFRAADVVLSDPALTVSDLPVFVGKGTALVPVRSHPGRSAKALPPAQEWHWRDDGLLIGVGQSSLWRYDPQLDELITVPRPPGLALLAPDGRHLAVAVCSKRNSGCQLDPNYSYTQLSVYDIVIVPTDGGPWLRFLVAGSYPAGYKFGFEFDVGVWSPDSQMLLVPRIRTGQRSWGPRYEFSVLTLSGVRYFLPGTGRWRWLWDGSLIDREGDRYSPPPERALVQSEVISPDLPIWLGRSLLTHPVVPRHLPFWSGELGWVTLDTSSGSVTAVEALRGIDQPSGNDSVWWESRSRDDRWLWKYGQRGDASVIILFDLESGAGLVAPVPWDSRYTGRRTLPVAVTSNGLRWSAAAESGEVRLYEMGAQAQVLTLAEFQQPLGRGVHSALAPFSEAAWSSDGDRAALVVHEDPFRVRGWGADGLRVVRGASWNGGGVQVRVYDRDDGLVGSFRAVAQANYWTGLRPGWSPDGHWFIVGGRALTGRDRGWSD